MRAYFLAPMAAASFFMALEKALRLYSGDLAIKKIQRTAGNSSKKKTPNSGRALIYFECLKLINQNNHFVGLHLHGSGRNFQLQLLIAHFLKLS